METKTDNDKNRKKLSLDCQEQFEQLIRNSFDMLVLIDEDKRQLYVSNSCEKILGYEPEELLGVFVIDEFIHPEDQEKVRDGLWDIIHNAKNEGTQYRHRHKNGGWVHLEAFGTNQLDNPRIQSVVLNVRDITNRKKTEEKLVKNRNELRELNATKDRFFSIIGHDLKNPINNIIGLSDLMLAEIQAGEYNGVEEYTSMINHSSKKAIELLSNLLNWARSQTGKINYRASRLSLTTLADKTIDFLSDSAKRKSISLQNRVRKNFDLIADPVMLELIIRNLLSNGIKFTPYGGSVSIEAQDEADCTWIFVEDTGVGIPQEDIKKLFRIDFNYSTKGTQKETGTGLGLLLCQEFIGMHGGQIRVDSKEGVGTRFSFTIPKT